MITIPACNMPSFPDGMGAEMEGPPAGQPISTSPPNIISVPPPCSDPQPPHTLMDVNQGNAYWAGPHASFNHDLTRVMFTSNEERSGTEG